LIGRWEHRETEREFGTEKTEHVGISPSIRPEKIYWDRGLARVAGVDEAGRGCLAGPVVAAAVIFPPFFQLEGVRDSKALSPAQREAVAADIRRTALAVGVGLCSPEEIDRLNILWASLEAMRRAAAHLDLPPDVLLVDGNRGLPDAAWPTYPLVGGDARCHGIAAASIVAKTVRDALMRDLHAAHPEYGWAKNAGYPTPAHYAALERHGPTPHHRRSFRLVRSTSPGA
jgi:ribonuclease HII